MLLIRNEMTISPQDRVRQKGSAGEMWDGVAMRMFETSPNFIPHANETSDLHIFPFTSDVSRLCMPFPSLQRRQRSRISWKYGKKSKFSICHKRGTLLVSEQCLQEIHTNS